MTRNSPACRFLDTHRHSRADGLGPQQVTDLLLRTAHRFGQLGLRAVVLDRGLDVIMECLHTSFLVLPPGPVNKETCLAERDEARNLSVAMSVAANLRRFREEAGLSQVELADLAGVSQQLVSQIERGKNVSTKYLPQIATALKRTVGEIDPSYRTGDVLDHHLVREIAELAAQLSEQERRLLLGAAQGLIAGAKAEG